MKKILMVLLIVGATASGAFPGTDDVLSEVPRISAEAAYLKYLSGTVLIVNTMNPESFRLAHVLGAINMPADGEDDLDRIRYGKLKIPLDKEIILYCE